MLVVSRVSRRIFEGVEMNIKKVINQCLVVLSMVFLIASLSGCSTTSSGFGLGMVGSDAWFKRTSQAEQIAYFKSKSLQELKSGWSKSYIHPTTRSAISMELERRGLDGQMFYDPAADYKRQAEAQELGQAFSQALQEANRVNQAGPGAGTTNQNNAPIVQNNAPAVIGSQNITYRQVGNTTYGSDGTSYRKSGNTIYGSDGTSYRQSGNTTYGSDGTSYRKSGNTTYGSDGTTYRQSGNTFYGSDGTNCRAIGNTIYCN